MSQQSLTLLVLAACLVPFVRARSNGDFETCSIGSKAWGCKRFARKNNRNRNTKGPCCKGYGGKSDGPANIAENKCANRCCDESPGIMFWVDAPKSAGGLYSIRTGKRDPAADPKSYVPGEITNIYVHVNARDAKFTGLLMNALAVEHGNKIVGEWIFPSGETNPLYYSSVSCPKSAVHTSAEEKPYTSVLRWRAPLNVDGKPLGKIRFNTLIKRGGANWGQFYLTDLTLTNATRPAAGDMVWVQAKQDQDCFSACKDKGALCWPESLQAVGTAANMDTVSREIECATPFLAGCGPSATPKSGRCYYRQSDCKKSSVDCNTVIPGKTMACPCGSLSAYKNTFPDGRGGGKEVDAGSRSCVHTVLMLVLVCCLRLGTQRVDQGASVAVALLCLLAMASTVHGHNWAHSEFRARRKAQSKKPCPPRVGKSFGVQVGPKQEFSVAWATGHGNDATVVLMRGDKLHLVGRDVLKLAQKYISEAPSDAHIKGARWERQHGSTKNPPHTTDAAKFMSLIPKGHKDWHISGIVEEEKPTTNIFKIADSRLKDDVHVSYQHNDLDFIAMAGVFKISEVNFGEFDQIRLVLPEWAEPGHYVLIWDWQGYGDCLDIELRTKPVAHVYGKGGGGLAYNRVEHCQLAEPFKRFPGICRRAAPTVEQCFKDIDDADIGDYGFKGMRIGINVVPMIAAPEIKSLFARSDGASVDVPWDSEQCLAGGPLDLKGVETWSDDTNNWQKDWENRRTLEPGKACRQTIFTGEETLKRAVQRCTENKCIGVALKGGKYSGCQTTTADSEAKFYGKTPTYKYSKTDLQNMQEASYKHLVTVSFQPAKENFPLPQNTVKDIGATFSDNANYKGSWRYGWTACKHESFTALHDFNPSVYPKSTVENTFAWYPSQLCPKTPTDKAVCNNRNGFPLFPPEQCTRNKWEIAVDNGWYKIVSKVGPFSETSGGRPKRPDRNDNWNKKNWVHQSCAVEGRKFEFKNFGGNQNSYTNWVEVTDGRITFEDAAGWYGCCYIYQCDGINAMEIYKQEKVVRQQKTWFPQHRNPFYQRAFPTKRKISVVSMRAPEDECLHSWLLHGGTAHCSGQVASGWFVNSGAEVYVSDTPCTANGCPKDAQFCGRVEKSRMTLRGDRNHFVKGFDHNVQPDAGMRSRYWVNCDGKEGKYVFITLPSAGTRILAVDNIFINQLSPTSGDLAEFKDKFVCYPVQAREPSEHTPEYITTEDPEDPVFYSTCFMRERQVVYLPEEKSDDTKAPANYEFNGRCLPCDLFEQNRSPKTAVPNIWRFSYQCQDCDALAKGSKDTCTCKKPQ